MSEKLLLAQFCLEKEDIAEMTMMSLGREAWVLKRRPWDLEDNAQ